MTPYAWAKLRFLRDLGPTEVGGFGIAAPGDPLLIEDVHLLPQRATAVSVVFDDEGVADFFDAMVDRGHVPGSFARVWCHTHPADSAEPSPVDEETFERCFGDCDWAVMVVLARGGDVTARLRFGVGPGGDLEIPVEIAWEAAFDGSDPEAWEAEYAATVEHVVVRPTVPSCVPWDASEWDRFHGEDSAWDDPDWDEITWRPTDEPWFAEDAFEEGLALA